MQPKVSMVIPCYNKVKWIGTMLDSVIAQKWDNIEVVLVNDGSTDGTREVIEQYIPRIKARGYKPVIINQENQGLPGAIKSGLMRITGEYVCMPDCDDELDSEYVSAMAGWLWEHPNDHWVVCDIDRFSFDYSYVETEAQASVIYEYPYKLLESFLLGYVLMGVTNAMVRFCCLKECRVIDTFITEPRVAQEPQIWIPLALGGARPVHIRKTLYRYLPRESSLSKSLKTYTEMLDRTEKYLTLVEKTLLAQKTIDEYDRFLLSIGKAEWRHRYLSRFPEYNAVEAVKKLIDVFNKNLFGYKIICEKTALESGCRILLRYIACNLIGRLPCNESIRREKGGRIIAYAAFGAAACDVKAGLLQSDIKPDIYWDIKAAAGDRIVDIPVVQPDFSSLKPSDSVLILIKDNVIAYEVSQQIKAVNEQCRIWYYTEVLDYLVGYYYSRG